MTGSVDPAERALGTDLALTRLFGADEWGVHDLLAEPRRRPGPVARFVDSPTGDPEPTDLATLTGRENLAQAVILRLLTPVGALAELGHAGYGSRLGELVGREKDDVARFLCRRHVLESLAAEPRVEVVDVAFADAALERPDALSFVVTVQPVPAGAPFAIGFEVTL